MEAVTEGEMRIAYHPNLERLPELCRVLEKIEFLNELTEEQRDRCVFVLGVSCFVFCERDRRRYLFFLVFILDSSEGAKICI